MTEQNSFNIAELQQKANDGDAQAQFDLALCYAKGTNTEKNDDLALSWHKKAAEQGHVKAQFALGLFYLMPQYFLALRPKWEIFINPSLFEREPNLKEYSFANLNAYPAFDLVMQYRMNWIKDNHASDDLAFFWLQKAALQNHPDASYWQGKCYRDGIGIDQNDDLSFECFKKAAEQGCSDAYFDLARGYSEGIGCQQNHELAFIWTTKAVEFANSYYFVDIKHGTPAHINWESTPDYEKNLANSYLLLGKLYAEGKGVAKNDEQAFKWLAKAAENNVAEAQFRLAQCYKYGIGVETDISLANQWYEAAAVGKFSDAETQYRLAKECICSERSDGKAANTGFISLIKACRNDSLDALKWLEETCTNFIFPYIKNRTDREECYKFAANFLIKMHTTYPRDYETNFVLGVMSAFGLGMPKDKSDAASFFNKVWDGDVDAPPEVMGGNHYLIDSFAELLKKIYAPIEEDVLGILYTDNIALAFAEQKFTEGYENKKMIVLPALQYAFYMRFGEYDLAHDYFKSLSDTKTEFEYSGAKNAFELIGLIGLGEIEKKNRQLREKNKALEAEIKQKELLQIKMQKLVEQFTHTLGNVIFPDTIYQVAERLKNTPAYRKDVLLLNEAYHSEIIIKLQAELLRQRYANSNPEKFRQMIRACRRAVDSGDKTKSIADILDYAASRVTARLLNQHNASLGSIRDKIISQKNVSLDALRQRFEDDILLNRSLCAVEWINQNLRPFKVGVNSPLWQKVCILGGSHAEALLFGYFSEVLFNAFKYADHGADQFLTVRFDETICEGKTYLTCSWYNPLGDKTPSSLGTGKGLDAILEDLKQLNDTESDANSMLIAQDDQQFQVTMFFQKDLLINDAPILKMPR